MQYSITPQIIYEQTNGGLDIILRYYPQAELASQSKKNKFKIRDEKTPSCGLREYNSVWYVKDYGSSDSAMNAIEIVMKEDRLDFPDALKQIAQDFTIEGKDGKTTTAKAGYERREATETEKAGDVRFNKKDWTLEEFKTIFAMNVWDRLCKLGADSAKKEIPSDETGMKAAKKITDEYNLYSLAWYSTCSADKKDPKKLIVHTFTSNENYPILMFDEGQWQKFYKPKEREPQHRFFSTGNKPNNYLFGKFQLTKRQQEYNEIMQAKKLKKRKDDDEGEEGTSHIKEFKLDEVVLVSGGSDAMNVIACGYPAVWMNSETAILERSDLIEIKKNAHKVYNLPDIDDTGKREAIKLALKFLEIHTIYLPETLRRKNDLRGKACKDLRDYFRYHTTSDFEALVKMAYPLQFWDEDYKVGKDGEPIMKRFRKVVDYKPNNELIYNFLFRMGFGLLEMKSEKTGDAMVQIQGHVVSKVLYNHVNRFIKDFLRGIHSPIDLINAFHRSPHFSEKSLSNLPYVNLQFEDHAREFQYMFFQNEIWKITADDIIVTKPEKCDRYVWGEEVINHEVTRLEQSFKIFMNEKTGKWDIEIKNKDCLFLRFAINASRVYWRNELEVRLDGKPAQFRDEYLEQNKFAIDGPLLTDEEIQEQKQHLIAKLLSFGYLLHRYKDPANPLCVWSVDYNIENSDDSNGGTGKSMFYQALSHLMKYEPFDGRNDKLTLNPHLYENITEHTDLMLIDDASKYFNFDFFYPAVTGPIKVNPKGTTGYIIHFEKSPKMAITSNFPPKKNDKTTRRRLWFTAFADYFHKNPNGEYREERLPKGEFGKTLFNEYTKPEWNLFLNTAADCCQQYLIHGQVEPPMETLMTNQYKNAMGETFHAWADAYFSEENKRLDCLVERYIAFEEYKRGHQNQISPQGFLEKLKNWCYYYGFTLNPEACKSKPTDKRILKWGKKKEYVRGGWQDTDKKEAVECIYIQTDPDKEITMELAGEDDLPF